VTDLFRYLVVFGIQSAAIYAVAASGLVVTYATSGVFNFAHGAIGMLAAFSYWELSQQRGVPTWLALLIVLFIEAPAIGYLLDRVIMRRLAGTSTITTIVVTIGLLVAFVSLAGIIWPQGTSTRILPRFFAGSTVSVLGTNVDYHTLIVLGCAIAVAVGLRLVLYRTRLGVAMRAVVDNRELGALNGVNPNRISSFSWMLGCMLAGLAGVLIAPILPQFTPVALTLLVITAYAAAMVGKLRSLPLTFLGAVILGEFENLLAFIDTKGIGGDTVSKLAGNLQTSAPVILLFLVLLFLPGDQGRFNVKTLRNRIPKPKLRTIVIAMAVYVAGAVVVAQSGWVSQPTVNELGKGIALGVIMLSLVLLTGYAGQVSLAQLAFGGIGAVVVWKWGPTWGLLAAVVIAALVGALIALPALRLQGLYLALATMAFALFLEQSIYGNNAIFDQLKPFAVGNAQFKRFPGLEGTTAMFIAMAVVFALIAVLLTVIRNGAFGRRLQAMNDSSAACATLGLDLTVTKLQVFALSAGIAGLGGAMLGMWKGTSVGRSDFSLLEGALPGLALVLVAVVGGITSVAGSIFGSIAFVMMPVVGAWYAALTKVMNLLPGVAGVGLGTNPDGVVCQTQEGVQDALDRDGHGRPGPVPGLAVPELLGFGRPVNEVQLAALDDELGLSWGDCKRSAAPSGNGGAVAGDGDGPVPGPGDGRASGNGSAPALVPAWPGGRSDRS